MTFKPTAKFIKGITPAVLIFEIVDPNEGTIPNIIFDQTKKFLKNTVPNPSPSMANIIKQPTIFNA